MTTDPYLELAYGVLDDGMVLDDDGDRTPAPDLSPALLEQSGGRYSDDVRLLAFRLWVFDGARNVSRVSRLLQSRHGVKVHPQTIGRWARNDDWSGRGDRLHQTFVKSSTAAVNAGISAAAVRAVATLDDIQTDPHANAGARVKAATTILGIAGFVPAFNGTTVNLALNAGRDRFAGMTDAELEELAASYRDDGDTEHPAPNISEAEYRLAKVGDGTGHYRPQRYLHNQGDDDIDN